MAAYFVSMRVPRWKTPSVDGNMECVQSADDSCERFRKQLTTQSNHTLPIYAHYPLNRTSPIGDDISRPNLRHSLDLRWYIFYRWYLEGKSIALLTGKKHNRPGEQLAIILLITPLHTYISRSRRTSEKLAAIASAGF